MPKVSDSLPAKNARKSLARPMIRIAAAALACAAATAVAWQSTPIVQAFPKPSVYPVAWELKFEHSEPKRIAFQAPGEASAKAYWYMTFTVTNNTDSEQQFLPVFEMVTKDGTIVRSNKDISPAVFEEIKRREKNPALESLSKITGRLLVGPDQARESVAIWPESGVQLGEFSIFISGLSGETILVKDGEPIATADWTKYSPEDRAKFTLLQKTMELDYKMVGDATHPEDNRLEDLGQKWVMR